MIQSAIKMYIQSLDNSVVNAGEIKTAVGSSVGESLQGFINDKTGGLSYSASQLDNIFSAIMQIAETVDRSINEKIEGLSQETAPMLRSAVQLDRLTEQQAEQVGANIKEVLTTRLNKYKVLSGGAKPQGVFDDFTFGAKKKKGAPAITNPDDPFGDL
jgi:hypothetical protein